MRQSGAIIKCLLLAVYYALQVALPFADASAAAQPTHTFAHLNSDELTSEPDHQHGHASGCLFCQILAQRPVVSVVAMLLPLTETAAKPDRKSRAFVPASPSRHEHKSRAPPLA